MQSNKQAHHQSSLQPVLITSARQSRQAEIRHREQRYLIAMLVRVVVLLVAVVVLPGWSRFLGMVAAIVIPWLAVLYANAGPLRSRSDHPSIYVPDDSALPDDPYPLGDGHETIVDGEWTGGRRDRTRHETGLPALTMGSPAERAGPSGGG